MAPQVTNWVFRNAPTDLSAGEMLVALALANRASKDGRNAFPSIGDLSRESRLCERQVGRVLKKLVSRGVIEVERMATNKLPTMYCFPALGGDIRSKESADVGVTLAPTGGDIGSALGVTSCPVGVTFDPPWGDISDTTLIGWEPSEEPSEERRLADDASPYAIFAAICEASGLDASAFAEREKSKHIAVAKRLLAEGATVAEIHAHVGWLKSQTWRTQPITAFTVEKGIGVWRASGRPERETTRRPKTQADHNKGGTGKLVL